NERALEVVERDRLLLLVPRDRVGLARELRFELLGRAQQVEPIGIEGGGGVSLERAQLLPLVVVREKREPRLRRSQRQLLAAVRDARGQDRVLERVVALGELGEEQAGLAGLPQPVEPLALVAVGAFLGVSQDVELVAAEEVGVARDDRRLLRDLL